MHCSVPSAKLSGKLCLPCIRKQSRGHKVLPSSCSRLCSPSSAASPLSLSLSLPLSLSVGLSLLWKDSGQVWQEKRQMAGMTGETFGVEREIRQCEERDVSSTEHTHAAAHTFYYPAALLAASASHINHYLGVHKHTGAHKQTHTVHMPSIISLWCSGLEADRHDRECDSL